MNKKGQFQIFLPFLLIGIVLVIAFAIIVVPMSKVIDDISFELKKPENFGSSNVSVDSINTVQNLSTTAFDQMIFIFLFGIILSTIIFGIFTDFSPVVITVLILSLIIFVIVAGIMAEAFNEVEENEILEDKASEFTLTNIVLGKQFPILIGIAITISILIIFAKRGRVVTPV